MRFNLQIRHKPYLIIFLSISFSILSGCNKSDDQFENRNFNFPAPIDWPSHFFISATKAYKLARNEGLDLKSYSYGNKIYKDFNASETAIWEEVVERSANEKDFIIVITRAQWQEIVGSRHDMPSQLMNSQNIYNYLSDFKEKMIKLSEAKGAVVFGFEPDPMATWMAIIRNEYNNDPNNIPAKLNDSGIPEVLELNPPQNFAGFWQVIDYIRKKYAPNVMLAPTVKVWGLPGNTANEPPEGWAGHPNVLLAAEQLENFGVNWDALAFNYNPGSVQEDSVYLKIARYVAEVAKEMDTHSAGKRVRPYFWKTKTLAQHYTLPESEWTVPDISFQMRHINYLVSIGYAGMNIGYGNQLIEYDILPPLVKCWLEEYFNGEEGECEPHATLGPILLQ